MPARQDGSQMELSLGTRPGAQQWASAQGYLPGNPFCSLLLLICFNSSTLEARKFSNCCSAANGFGKWACHGLRLCTLQVFPLAVRWARGTAPAPCCSQVAVKNGVRRGRSRLLNALLHTSVSCYLPFGFQYAALATATKKNQQKSHLKLPGVR